LALLETIILKVSASPAWALTLLEKASDCVTLPACIETESTPLPVVTTVGALSAASCCCKEAINACIWAIFASNWALVVVGTVVTRGVWTFEPEGCIAMGTDFITVWFLSSCTVKVHVESISRETVGAE
jgi:hypothetical protein